MRRACARRWSAARAARTTPRGGARSWRSGSLVFAARDQRRGGDRAHLVQIFLEEISPRRGVREEVEPASGDGAVRDAAERRSLAHHGGVLEDESRPAAEAGGAEALEPELGA